VIPSRSVITFATNKLEYVQFALNCAESVLLHNDLPVYIVSNIEFPIPEKLRDKIFNVPAKPGHAELGIGIKLHTDEYLQTDQTLFIDSDCICFSGLDDIFNAAEGMDVTVAGNIVPAESWCGPEQAKTIKEVWDADQLIRYNGGLYYFRKSETTKKIFDQAREIAEKYDDYGFSRIKNKWINEEGPLSIAMTLNGQRPVADDGRFITDLYTDMRPAVMNVLKGKRVLRNKPVSHPNHRPWYPALYSPVIIHYGGSSLKSYPYRSQSMLLKLQYRSVAISAASSIVGAFIHFPYRTFHWLRSALRAKH
jgi:hypothetical protein